jgi:hypothetical protein
MRAPLYVGKGKNNEKALLVRRHLSEKGKKNRLPFDAKEATEIPDLIVNSKTRDREHISMSLR